VLVVLALLAAATQSDRFPLPVAGTVLALLAPGLGAGLLGRSWWLLALAPFPAVAGFGLAYVADDNPWLPLFAGVLLALASLPALPAGVGVARRSLDPRLPVVGARCSRPRSWSCRSRSPSASARSPSTGRARCRSTSAPARSGAPG